MEELARQAGLRVDTIRYYQAKGLLPPPRRQGRVAWYSQAHLARLERIRALAGEGLTLAVIRRILDGELDAADVALAGALAHEVAADAGELLSLEELAERTGIPAPLLQAVASEGLLVPRRVGGRQGYNTEDVAVARAGLALLERGIPLPELLELARAHDQAMREVARRAVELFDTHVRHQAAADADAATRLVDAFQALLPATTTLVTHHFTRVLLDTALEHIEHVGTADELDAVARAEGGSRR